MTVGGRFQRQKPIYWRPQWKVQWSICYFTDSLFWGCMMIWCGVWLFRWPVASMLTLFHTSPILCNIFVIMVPDMIKSMLPHAPKKVHNIRKRDNCRNQGRQYSRCCSRCYCRPWHLLASWCTPELQSWNFGITQRSLLAYPRLICRKMEGQCRAWTGSPRQIIGNPWFG